MKTELTDWNSTVSSSRLNKQRAFHLKLDVHFRNFQLISLTYKNAIFCWERGRKKELCSTYELFGIRGFSNTRPEHSSPCSSLLLQIWQKRIEVKLTYVGSCIWQTFTEHLQYARQCTGYQEGPKDECLWVSQLAHHEWSW